MPTPDKKEKKPKTEKPVKPEENPAAPQEMEIAIKVKIVTQGENRVMMRPEVTPKMSIADFVGLCDALRKLAMSGPI